MVSDTFAIRKVCNPSFPIHLSLGTLYHLGHLGLDVNLSTVMAQQLANVLSHVSVSVKATEICHANGTFNVIWFTADNKFQLYFSSTSSSMDIKPTFARGIAKGMTHLLNTSGVNEVSGAFDEHGIMTSEIFPSTPEPAVIVDPLAAAKKRTDDNLRRFFGFD
jgi:hypothetical protein